MKRTVRIVRALSVDRLGLRLQLCSARGRCADVIRVGEGPFITGGGILRRAASKGYFKKIGIEVQVEEFHDGALAVPAIVAGELDMTLHDGQCQPVQQRRQRRAAGHHSRSRP